MPATTSRGTGRPKSVTLSALVVQNSVPPRQIFVSSARVVRCCHPICMVAPIAACVPHTAKRPERCPNCGSISVSRKGTRRKKLEIVQLWRCGSCKRVFTPTPAALRNKTYPLRIVLDAITLYDLGYSLTETAAKLRTRHGRQIARSTIATWLHDHEALTTYERLRAAGRRLFPPPQTIRSVKLHHRQVYKFQYHRSKLDLLRQGREHRRLAPLADFLELIPLQCPHELFRESERASQATLAAINTAHLIVNHKENAATAMAALVIPTIGDNRLRHEALQRFMLVNDSTTLAVEVPIWLTPEENPRIGAAVRCAVARPRRGAHRRHHRPHRLSSGPQRRRPYSRLQARRPNQSADRAAHDLRARAYKARSRT
jgi:transposase-like protein